MAFQNAISSGSLDTIQALIEARIADVSEQAASLRMAVTRLQYDIVDLLLDSGVDVNCEGIGYGSLLLSDVVARGNPLLSKSHENNRMAVHLIERGADVNRADSDGKTPLMRAARVGNVALASYLIERGAHVDSVDNQGMTALEWAKKGRNKDISKLLSSLTLPGTRYPQSSQRRRSKNTRVTKSGELD